MFPIIKGLTFCLILSIFVITPLFLKSFMHAKQTITNISSHEANFREFMGENANYTATPNIPQYSNGVIWLIIDALPYYAFNQQLQINGKLVKDPFGLLKILKNNELNSFMMGIKSGNPTMTFNRVEALGTGSHPPFIKMAKSFTPTNLEEDNIIKSMHRNNMIIRCAGNDLWGKMFPEEYYTSAMLDTGFSLYKQIDLPFTALKEHLISKEKFNFYVSHYDELDHIFHKFKPDSDETLEEMDYIGRNIKENIIRNMADNTLLLVFGDHGTNKDGVHGGGSNDEINAGLFAYSKGRNFTFNINARNTENNLNRSDSTNIKSKKSAYLSQIILNKLGIERFPWIEEENKLEEQINLVATLAISLGFDIPFTNLGSIIPSLMSYDPSLPIGDSLLQLLNDYINNYFQVLKYIKTYAQHDWEFISYWRKLNTSFQAIKPRIYNIRMNSPLIIHIQNVFIESNMSTFDTHTTNINEGKYVDFMADVVTLIEDIRAILKANSKYCANSWVSFDLIILVFSEILQIFNIFLLFAMYFRNSSTSEYAPALKYTDFLNLRGICCLLICCICIAVTNYLDWLSFLISFLIISFNLYNLYPTSFDVKNLISCILKPIHLIPVIFLLILLSYISSSSLYYTYTQPNNGLGYICISSIILVFLPHIRVTKSTSDTSKYANICLLMQLISIFSILPTLNPTLKDEDLTDESIFYRNVIFTSPILSVALPSIGIYISYIYILWSKTPGLGVWVKILYTIGGGIITYLSALYSIAEMGIKDNKLEELDDYHRQALPRIIYTISLSLLVIGIVLKIIYKKRWNYSFQLDIILSVSLFPLFPMLSGPKTYIIYLLGVITPYIYTYLGHILNIPTAKLSFGMLYAVIVFTFYIALGHYPDINKLNFHRGFIGFPEFIIPFNIIILLFENIGCMWIMLFLFLINYSREANNYEYLTEKINPSFVMINTEEETETENLQDCEENKNNKLLDVSHTKIPIVTHHNIGKVLGVLIGFEILHTASFMHLIYYFNELFFDVAPVAFMNKFIIWVIYLLLITIISIKS